VPLLLLISVRLLRPCIFVVIEFLERPATLFPAGSYAVDKSGGQVLHWRNPEAFGHLHVANVNVSEGIGQALSWRKIPAAALPPCRSCEIWEV
jgi:hypothetical protein